MTGDTSYPTSYTDSDRILAYVETIRGSGRSFRYEKERLALRNILYYLGIQWIKYDDSYRVWRPIALRKSTPRPVTNKFASIVNSVSSTLVGYKIPIKPQPASDEAQDIAAANVADDVLEIIEREVLLRRLKPLISKWVLLTGDVFLETGYDTSPASGTTFIQDESCLSCGQASSPDVLEQSGGICPNCQQPGPYEPAIGESGKPIGTDYPKGKMLTEVHPFPSCFFDLEVPFIEDSPYFMIRTRKPRDWVVSTYGEAFADSCDYDTQSDSYGYFLNALTHTSAIGGGIWGGKIASVVPYATVERLWLKPQPGTWATEGVHATIVGGKIPKDGSSSYPYHDSTGRPMLNIVHIKFDDVPGRVLGRTRCDDLAPKQEQRNMVESIVQLHAQRMANSIWLLPEGVGVSKLTGEQGQVIRYNALAGVPEPRRVPGDPISPYLIQWLGIIDQEMDDIMGTYDVSRGEVPFKGASYAIAQLLDERAQQSQSGLMENWGGGFIEWSRQCLNIWREFADEERTLSTGEGKWAVKKFNKANLEGGVNLTIDYGQYRPHSNIGKRAAIEQAARLSFLNPFNPEEKYKGLVALGIPELMPDYKLDYMRASRVNDLFMELAKGGDPSVQAYPPVVYPWENHAVALQVRRRLILSEEFDEFPPAVRNLVIQDAMQHWQFMAQAASTQAGPGTVAPGPAGGSKGTAKGDKDMGGEGAMVERDAQGASPDTNSGGGMM